MAQHLTDILMKGHLEEIIEPEYHQKVYPSMPGYLKPSNHFISGPSCAADLVLRLRKLQAHDWG